MKSRLFANHGLKSSPIKEALRHQLTSHSVGLKEAILMPEKPHDEDGSGIKLTKQIFRRLCEARLQKSDEDIRNHALTKLKGMIIGDPRAPKLGLSLLTKAGKLVGDEVLGRSIVDAFANKASSTLEKRASALVRFSSWIVQFSEESPLRLSEPTLYGYLNHLRESGASSSSAQGIIEALRFFDGVVKLTKVKLDDTISARCQGIARDLRLRKRPLEQKSHLPAAVVMELEKLICSLEAVHHRCILGQILFCLHACCRWKDSIRMVDVSLLEEGELALLEGRALVSKTSLQQNLNSRFIPYIAIGTGLSGTQWGLIWLDARAIEFGSRPTDHFLPSFSERTGKWSSQPMSASEAVSYLREFMSMTQLIPDEQLREFGTHSLKTTLLTYIGRCGNIDFTAAERRLMGHHIKPKDKSMITYSREAFTLLYGKVYAMFRLIRSGEFDPDKGVEKRILSVAEHYVQSSQSDLPLEQDDCSSSGSSSVETDPPLPDSVPSSSRVFVRSPFPEGHLDRCFVHRISGICHLKKVLSDFTFCGRKVTGSYIALESCGIEGDPDCCINCGKALKASVE